MWVGRRKRCYPVSPVEGTGSSFGDAPLRVIVEANGILEGGFPKTLFEGIRQSCQEMPNENSAG